MKDCLYINEMSLITCLGATFEDNLQGILSQNKSGMIPRDDLIYEKKLSFGTIDKKYISKVPKGYLDIECNRILFFCIKQIEEQLRNLVTKYGKKRIAIIIGSSNTGIHEGQKALDEFLEGGNYPSWFSYDMLELGSPAKFIAEYLGIEGVFYTVSTACSSSLKVFTSAKNLIDSGVCDAAIVGGVDSLCSYASNGFYSLEALSENISNPFSKNRDGISLGEGGALFIVSKEKTSTKDISVLGVGETSDAHHMTSPLPNGAMAQKAMQMAIDEAGINAKDIGYVSLHGTGTELNDSMESRAVYNIFKDNAYCSSFKPLIGHTLGACGSVEVALCCLLLSDELNKENKIPPHPWDGVKDEQLSPINLATAGQVAKLKYIISNSFAFGGSNASIVIGRDE